MLAAEIFGNMGLILSCVLNMPLLARIYNKKNADNLSRTYLAVSFWCYLSWLIYGVLINSMHLIVADAIQITMFLLIIVLKVRYKVIENEVNKKMVEDIAREYEETGEVTL